ncbi:MAG: cytochrome c oxidase subunit II [Acidimicrobiales bacterium]
MARRGAVVVVLLLASSCSDGAPSVLEPRSEAGRRIEGLWWLTFWTSVVVVVVVTAFLLAAVRRGKRSVQATPAGETGDGGDEIDRRPVAWGDRFIVIAGLVVSGAILAGVFGISLRQLHALARPPSATTLTIEVIGHNWWWEVRYPNGAVTANEIYIPVGEAVDVRLPTADVIHSFWVPQLSTKRDSVPGQENALWLLAEQPGRYRGQCAEFCGLQHARMAFFVNAQPRDQFRQWLANEAAPAREPTTSGALAGREIFLRASCAGCHAVRGTSASGTLGPDLTHLASRPTIAAGTLPMQRDTLTDFVRDAQRAKPGATMPPTEVGPGELVALVDYLLTLQ